MTFCNRYMETKNLQHKAFEWGIFLKGIDGLLEVVGGIILFFLDPATLNRLILGLTQHELSQDPHDFVAAHLLNFAHNFSVDAQIFGAIYLLSHGFVKMFLVDSLWRKRLWSYPAAIIIFAVFAIYQIYRYTFTHSILLLALTVLDAAVIWLTWEEYERIKT